MNWVYFAPNCCEELTGSISSASGNENSKQFYPAVLWSINRLLSELAKYQVLWKPLVFCFLRVFSIGLARKQSRYWHAQCVFHKMYLKWDRRSQCIQKVSLIAQITMVSSSNKVMWNSCNEESLSQRSGWYHLCCNIHLKSAKPPWSVFNWCLILLLVNLRSNLNKKIVLLFPLKCTTALKEKMNQYVTKEAIVKRVRKKKTKNRIWIEEIHFGTSPILFNRIRLKEGLNQEHLSLH